MGNMINDRNIEISYTRRSQHPMKALLMISIWTAYQVIHENYVNI